MMPTVYRSLKLCKHSISRAFIATTTAATRRHSALAYHSSTTTSMSTCRGLRWPFLASPTNHSIRSLCSSVGPGTSSTVSPSRALVAGLDEAGRGAALGPLVIAVVVLDPKTEKYLLELGVKDSKKVTKLARERLAPMIKQHSVFCSTLYISAQEIDERRRSGENLNKIELNSMVQLIDMMQHASPYPYQHGIAPHLGRVVVDSVDGNSERFGSSIETLVEQKLQCTLLSEHQADQNHAAVAAASIVAKVERDTAMQSIGAVLGVSIGSGYPSDSTTRAFLEQYYTDRAQEQSGEHVSSKNTQRPYVRHSWRIASFGDSSETAKLASASAIRAYNDIVMHGK
jgi:ribonuclease HII